MKETQQPDQDGANGVVGVEGDITEPRRRAFTTVAPFDGRPVIVGAVGYLALAVVVVVGIGLLESGVSLWPLVVAVLIVILGIWWLRRL